MWRSARLSILLLLGTLVASGVRGQTITEFSIPTPTAEPHSIVAGPDGNLWFTESGWISGRSIGRVTPTGVITVFVIRSSYAAGIAAGLDGNLWFAAEEGFIGRITPTGVVTEFPVPRSSGGPHGIVAGPDGNLWFTDGLNGWGPISGSKIGRITTSGDITEFPVPTSDGGAYEIAAGPDGNLWFTEVWGNRIARITTSGVITEFPLPTPDGSPSGIAAGPDGNLWFTEPEGNRIGRITTSGDITEFPLSADSAPSGIAAGPDGSLWFTEVRGNKIGRITTAGTVTEFPVPTPGSSPGEIAAGPDGNLWFTEERGNKIGRITPGGVPGTCMPDSTTLCLTGGRFKARANWTTANGTSGFGQAVSLTGEAGYFWFFSSNNVEMLLKVLDGCAINSSYWVFAAGLTDVHVVLTVTDTTTGAVRTYTNPLGSAFRPVQDIGAFGGP